MEEPSEPLSAESKREMVNGKPPAQVNKTDVVQTPANDNCLSIGHGTGATRRKKKTRTTVATTEPTDGHTPFNESAPEGHNNSKPQRFILFVGNLPYSATTSQIESHFSKLAPKSIRHSTDKSTGRSKGFAFLEFSGYDKMKTCLKLYHHSIFESEASNKGTDTKHKDKKKAGRRINVELTDGL